MKSKYLGILILLVISCTSNAEKDNWAKEVPEIKYSKEREKEVWGEILRGDNSALYYGTPLYDLAKALSNDTFLSDKEEIIKLIDAVPKEYINFQEKKFGMTIGIFALWGNNKFVITKLLDRGLNPNLRAKNDDNIIVKNLMFNKNLTERVMILKYMIKKGANVNLYSKMIYYKTPLMAASQGNDLESVKILVKAGADPHFIDESAYSPFNSVLSVALQGSIDVVNYLIFDQKVDFRTLKYPMDSKFHPGEYEILHNLRRNMLFKLNSKEYQEKMKLVAYLKTQGLDYWKTPIPDNIKNNPNYTPDYLSKY